MENYRWPKLPKVSHPALRYILNAVEVLYSRHLNAISCVSKGDVKLAQSW